AEGAFPLPVPHPHAFADARGRNAVAHGIDDAGAVALRDDAREGDLARQSLARFDVGRIDARGRELDAHLAAAGLRCVDVLDAHHIARRTVRFVKGRLHLLSPAGTAPLGRAFPTTTAPCPA